MLMTASRPEAKTVTGKGQALLKAIRRAGDSGIDRVALAAAIDKTALNKWDLAQLELLANRGLIRIATRPTARPHISEYVYHATDR